MPKLIAEGSLLAAPTGALVLSKPDRRNQASRTRLRHRVRAQFEEPPCLRLTVAQTRRLLGLREDVCQRVLSELVDRAVLWQGGDGRYATRG